MLSPNYFCLFNDLFLLHVLDNFSHLQVFICKHFDNLFLHRNLLLLTYLFILNFILHFRLISLMFISINWFVRIRLNLFFCFWFTLSFSWAVLVSPKLFLVFDFLRFVLNLCLLGLQLFIDIFQLLDLSCKIFLAFFVCFFTSFWYNFFHENCTM